MVGTRSEAEAARARFVVRLAATDPTESGAGTVAVLLERHLVALEQRCAPATIRGYRTYADNWILPHLGQRRAASVKPSDVEALVNRMRAEGKAPSSINQTRVLLSGAFDRACRDQTLERNPVKHTSREAIVRRQDSIPTNETLSELLEAARRQGPQIHAAVRLGSMAMLRRGEVVALRWSQINTQACELTINGALGYSADGHVELKTTKTMDVRRLVIDQETIDALHAIPRTRGGEWVISSDGGLTPWSPDRLSNQWQIVRSQVSEAEHVRFHDLRHWSVSALLTAGLPVHEIARRAGHSSANVTLSVYAHVMNGRDQQAADVLAEALAQKKLS